MAKGYSTDLRDRVVALVEGGESCREAARLLDLAASTSIRWMDRWHTTGSVAAKPGTGHCRSPLEPHKQWLLDLVAAEPDLTLDEIGTRLASAKRLKVGRTSIWRFYERHRLLTSAFSSGCKPIRQSLQLFTLVHAPVCGGILSHFPRTTLKPLTSCHARVICCDDKKHSPLPLARHKSAKATTTVLCDGTAE